LSTAQRLRARLLEALQRSHGVVDLREERDEDTSFVRALYAEVRAPELALVPWNEVQKRAFTDSQFSLQREHYRRHYPTAEFLLIERDGTLIGRVYVHASPDTICLMEISLVEAQRGQGIGTVLIRELLLLAAEHGATVTLHVEPNNPAEHLYTRLGFNFVEQRGVYNFMEWRPAAAS
jgi:GNAT superfamily N-acetyltransferase